MRRYLGGTAVLFSLIAALPAHAGTPGNDSPTQAEVISTFPATVEVDTSEATTGPFEEECYSGLLVTNTGLPVQAVWYRIDLPDDLQFITLSYDAFQADVVLWDYTTSVTDGTPILSKWACGEPNDPYPIYAEFGSLYMSVGTPLGAEIPPFSITIEGYEEPPPPAVPINDEPYRATEIQALPYQTAQATYEATFDPDPQGCPQGAFVWYTYTPPVSQVIDIAVSMDEDDDNLATLAAYGIGDEVTTLACADANGEPATATIAIEEGVPVLIGIGRYGLVSLSVELAGARPGDNRADAHALSLGASLRFDLTGATLESDEPTTCGSGGSAWFALPPLARNARVEATDAVSIAAVVGNEVLNCSTSGTLSLTPDSAATHLQVRAPLARTGSITIDFDPPFGVQVTDASPLAPGCGDRTDVVYADSEVEVSQAVDPNDPEHIAVTWQQDRYDDRGGARGIGAAVTFDGGETWTSSIIPRTSLCTGSVFQRTTDPWAAIDANGTVYVMSLGYNPGPDDLINLTNTVLLSRSDDGGLTWDDPIVVAASPGILFHDKETLTADPNTPGLLYAAWDVYPTNTAFPVFARSEDGGLTWTPPVPLPSLGSGAGDQIAVLDDGTLVAIAARGTMRSIASRDRGVTWSLPNEFASAGGAEGPPGVRGGAYIPSVWTDGESVFVSWSDTYITYFARSDDAGGSWDVSEVSGAHEGFPTRSTTAVAGTRDGTVAVLTYVVARNRSTWLALATSEDGGRTWGEHQITSAFDIERAPYSLGRGYFLGDYFGFAASGDDLIAAFAAVPPGEASGVSNVYSLRLTV